MAYRPPQNPAPEESRPRARLRRRIGVFALVLFSGFALVVGQLARLATEGGLGGGAHVARSLDPSWARPDIVDRNGRLLATDITTHSLFAEPYRVKDPDAVVLALLEILPELDRKRTLARLSKANRKFVWLKRGLTPAKAKAIHDLGFPGLRFRDELHRVYPLGRLAAHVLGTVNIDNRGQSGLERYIDEIVGIEPVYGPGRSSKPPLRLTIDVGAQFALEEELRGALERYGARGAAGVVLDVLSGEVLAASSLPAPDPNRGGADLDKETIDRLMHGRYELGSIFKMVTLAAAFEYGIADLETRVDTSGPLRIGRYTISDSHPVDGTQTVRDVFLRSSNIGAARLASALGKERLKAFLARIGLSESLTTEVGRIVPPRLPERWSDVHTMTVSYGHGIAVAPLQFAAAAATLVNGGRRVFPTFLRATAERVRYRTRPVLKPETSARLRALMRENVKAAYGTGRLADVAGFEVGGKTGTADIAKGGRYGTGGVIASFVAIFPASEPRYLTLVSIFEPKRTAASGFSAAAGQTAAPTTARIIRRIAPILGLLPRLAARDR